VAGINHETILQTGGYRCVSIEGIDPEVVKKLHRFMLRLRRCEEALIREYHPRDEMRCPIHFCVGQEAAPAALSLLLAPDDYLFSHHRSHGYFLAKGAPMHSLFAELYGRETGADGGLAGSQDISLPAARFYSGAILAGAIAIAAGTGLGLQLKDKPGVAVAGFGEGATDEGVFWEAVNYAALCRLPVVFICENNRYATYSSQLKRQPADDIAGRVAAFGIESRALFGNDAIAVHAAVAEAVRRARAGGGPSFIEAYTYRWCGHVGPEDDDYLNYRPEAERKFWRDHCPIALLEERMAARGLIDPIVKAALVDEIDAEIAAAFDFAKSSSFPRVRSWAELNYGAGSPVADRLLRESGENAFDQNQADAIPGPY
jgi:pyruvate dehydrogenase E1 component alpha subunit